MNPDQNAAERGAAGREDRPMKCLSFIGSGQLHPTTYCHGTQRCTTPVVQEALRSFFPVEEVVVFTTEGARQTNFPIVAERVKNCRPVSIPDGKTADELWEIFRIISDEVHTEARILFDITHDPIMRAGPQS